MKNKIKILAQENNQVCLFEEMTNASALSEKKPPLGNARGKMSELWNRLSYVHCLHYIFEVRSHILRLVKKI